MTVVTNSFSRETIDNYASLHEEAVVTRWAPWAPFSNEDTLGLVRVRNESAASPRNYTKEPLRRYDDARKTVNEALARKEATEAALARLLEPVGFVCGLPTDLVGERRR
jgi:hypothetical protein